MSEGCPDGSCLKVLGYLKSYCESIFKINDLAPWKSKKRNLTKKELKKSSNKLSDFIDPINFICLIFTCLVRNVVKRLDKTRFLKMINFIFVSITFYQVLMMIIY